MQEIEFIIKFIRLQLFEHQTEQLFFSSVFLFFFYFFLLLEAGTWHYVSPGQQSLDVGLPDPMW